MSGASLELQKLDFPAKPVGFMLPRTGPGTCASPIRIEHAKKTNIMMMVRNFLMASVVTGGRNLANGLGLMEAKLDSLCCKLGP